MKILVIGNITKRQDSCTADLQIVSLKKQKPPLVLLIWYCLIQVFDVRYTKSFFFQQSCVNLRTTFISARMIQLCCASNNPYKIEEIAWATGNSFQILSLQDVGCREELPETHETLEENAFEKATYVWEHFAINCFADDSGLEIEALGGEPGVDTAFYAGPDRDANKNMDLVLKKLQGISHRKARFRTCIALILNGEQHLFEGYVQGTIIEQKRGTGGFGYDPIFLPDGYSKTFAEMTLEEKGHISHRGIAVQKLVQFLQNLH